MKHLLILLAITFSTYSNANEEEYLAHKCTPWIKTGQTLSNGKPILPFQVFTVGHPAKYAYIKFEGGNKIFANVSGYGPYMSFYTESESVTVRKNGNNYVGEIRYFGKDGNYYVDGVETYDITCSNGRY